MRLSLLVLIASAFVLSVAVAQPTSREGTEVLDSNQEADVAEIEGNSEDLEGSNEKTIHQRQAKDVSSSSEEHKQDVNKEAKENGDSSGDSSSAEQKIAEDGAQVDDDQSSETLVRRRRTTERYRNLFLIATICPETDTTSLEEGDTLDHFIQIQDMYEICKGLPLN
ncbi:uncharacterized protein LOC108112047 [Drosophila eugracilis]|uniref:uncharacterized protein LOC108112047 n=1 Tax=Drosophila eugracilis TaxID=29029 RepID=UPI0007E65973|nr:uncharacterized protein LOC108112047 [Drosophila eugracilis]